MDNLLSELEAQSKWLRKVAAEIAAEGHNGWGNTCLQAADVIDTHRAEIAAAVRDARVLREQLRKVTSVAITALFDSHRDDVMSTFQAGELISILEISQPFYNESVEAIYREAWGAAMAREGE